jgi:hypothetical protein
MARQARAYLTGAARVRSNAAFARGLTRAQNVDIARQAGPNTNTSSR